MSRNNSGDYTLPSGINPVVTDTPISTRWANPTFGDVAQELTNSLDRNGKGGMLAPILNTAGTVSAPGISWTDMTDAGWYRNALNDIRGVIGGVDVTQHRNDTSTTAGEQQPFRVWDGSAFFAPMILDGGHTPSFTTLTAEGALTVSSGDVTVTGDVDVTTGNFQALRDVTVSDNIAVSIGNWSAQIEKGWAYGLIDDAGNILVDGGISTVSKSGGGTYTVTFDSSLSDATYPLVVVGSNSYSGLRNDCTVEPVSTTRVKVRNFNTTTGTSSAGGFWIMAYTGSNGAGGFF